MILSFDEISKQIETAVALQNVEYRKTPTDLYHPIEYIMSIGGKRLRPALVLMCCNLYSNDIPAAMPAALGLETFHNFTLLHDDIMDKADVRRGQPTVHRKWNENIAILSGDAMLIEAYRLMVGIQPDLLPRILVLFNQTATEVCEGQQYDMSFEQQADVSVDDYLQMIKLKTSVLLAACCKIGAIIGGAPATDADALYNFGLNMGLAFQIKDDLLDVYGDVAVFGKKIGGDIVANKKTFLLIKAIEMASAEQHKQLQALINEPQKSDAEKIAAVTAIYNALGVKEIAENLMGQYYTKAIEQLSILQLPTAVTQNISQLAQQLMQRNN